jgi:hypothetical protein
MSCSDQLEMFVLLHGEPSSSEEPFSLEILPAIFIVFTVDMIVYILLNDSASSCDCIPCNDNVISVQWTGEDVEWSGCRLIKSIIFDICLEDWENQQ